MKLYFKVVYIWNIEIIYIFKNVFISDFYGLYIFSIIFSVDFKAHILEEEKYLEIMDEIDSRKQRNGELFKWNNAARWSRYEVIQWFHDIEFKDSRYINKMHSVGVNGAMLLNDLFVESKVK